MEAGITDHVWTIDELLGLLSRPQEGGLDVHHCAATQKECLPRPGEAGKIAF
jgi:hypothetical protein